ncbi:unnamed protein product, partial [marine sediment metagenome]
MEKSKESVSKLLNKVYGNLLNNQGGKRGRVLHFARNTYLKRIFKTADRRNKMNYRIFSQRLTKEKVDILVDNKKNADYEIYQEDIKVLLNVLHQDIRRIAKMQFPHFGMIIFNFIMII